MRVVSPVSMEVRDWGEECASVQKVEEICVAFSIYVQTSLFPTLLEMNHTTNTEETCQPLLTT